VAPGRYQIMSVADPANVVLEVDEVNPPEFSGELRLRGWLALPQAAPPASAGASQQIALAAEKVTGAGLPSDDALAGEPAAPEYAIVTPPAHGVVTLSGATAIYTPDPGYVGPDRFAFTAAEPGTMLARPPATVSLTVGTPVAGAPGTAPAALAPRPRAQARRALAGSLRLRGRVATARFRARGMGRVAIHLRDRGRLVKRCVVRVRWGGRATCRATLPRGASARRLTAAAVQVRAGRVVARGRIAAAPPPQGRSANR
jgi:hypothetical protein